MSPEHKPIIPPAAISNRSNRKGDSSLKTGANRVAEHSEGSWTGLPLPHQTVLQLAWRACAAGTVGVGSAILDEKGEIISSARNATRDNAGDMPIVGTYVAHAEINALAQIPTERSLAQCTLFTSIQPCIMCAGAAVMAHVGNVRYMTSDPLFPNFFRLREIGEITRQQWPTYERCPSSQWTVLALVLSAHSKAWAKPDGLVMQTHERLEPEVAAFLRDIVKQRIFRKLSDEGAQVKDVLHAIWDELVTVDAARRNRIEGSAESASI